MNLYNYDGESYTDNLLPICTKHFSSLAQSQEDANFDGEFQQQAKKDAENIEFICTQIGKNQICITVFEVQEAIKKRKKKKAHGDKLLVSEHLILGRIPIAGFLAKIINCRRPRAKIPVQYPQQVIIALCPQLRA